MAETMWVARLHKTGEPLVVEKVPVPRPGSGELLLKLEASGICHTDLHVISGSALAPDAPIPLTLGHEGIGVVVEQGAGTKTALGTRMGAPYIHDTCGHCRSCRTGWESYCAGQHAHGYNAQGTFAEYVLIKEAHAPLIPAGLDGVTSAPLMCAGLTAYGAVAKSGLAPGKLGVVVGCGGLGQYAIQLAKLTGATVVAVDTSEAKLSEAARLGADACVLAGEEAGARIKAMGGADAVMNFAPTPQVWPMMTSMVNNQAQIIAVAMVPDPVPLNMEWLTYNGVNITGTAVGTYQQMSDFLRIADQKKIGIKTETVQLKDINTALTRLERGDVQGRFVIAF
jgi:alcohol dehydrogenase, propanol-preferring